MILHVAMMQALDQWRIVQWRIVCDCDLWVYRDTEGNFDCEECGFSW